MPEPAPRTCYCSRCLTTFAEAFDRCPNLSCRAREPKDGWGQLLEDGDVLDRNYLIEQRIAIGGAGVTYLARELDSDNAPTGPKLAIKVLYAQRDQGSYLRRLANEANILLELDHPNIVHIAGFVQRAGHSPYLITRFEDGGSLLDQLRRVGKLSIAQVAQLGVQLCSALDMAHERGVVHRDLKPENILLAGVPGPDEPMESRLTDFGIAKVYGGVGSRLTRVGAFVGTPQYAAPEQFEGVAPTPAADVYSMAAVLLFCITFRPVLADLDPGDPVGALEQLRQELPPTLNQDGESLELTSFNQFLAATMTYEAGDRVSIGEARRILESILAGEAVVLPHTRTNLPLPPPPPPLEVAPDPAVKTKDTFEGLLSKDDEQLVNKPAERKKKGIPAEDTMPFEPVDPDETTVRMDPEPEPPTPSTHPESAPVPEPQPASDPEPTPEPEPAEEKKGMPTWAKVGLGCLSIPLAGVVLMAAGIAIGVAKWPTDPVVLQAGEAEHTSLVEQLTARSAALADCGTGTVTVTLAIDGDGQVIQDSRVEAPSQETADCVIERLKSEAFERADDRDVKVAAAIPLGG
ncbi:MAG: serine/threonine protein kinase [Proteobacteria bacterium]|nr:serine/threonine protein kinase [Pseudomonadota bacterium]